MCDRKKSVIIQLVINWFLYNIALFVVLLMTCECFDHNEIETMIAMAVFSAGLSAMQYDLWALKFYKKEAKSVLKRPGEAKS